MCSSINDSPHSMYCWEVFQKVKVVPEDGTAMASKAMLQDFMTVEVGAGEATVEWYKTTYFMAVGVLEGDASRMIIIRCHVVQRSR